MSVQREKQIKLPQKLLQALLIAVLFFAVTMPFRHFFGLTGLTEVRPAAAFPPVFGILFGIWGAAGCAVGNLVADLLSGYSPQICIYGFAAQILYGYLPWLLWKKLQRKHSGEEETVIRFDSVDRVLAYIGIVSLDAFYMAAALGMILQALGLGKLFSQATMILFFNNLVFGLILGIPMLILYGMRKKKEKREALTLNVRFVLIFLLLSVISAVVMGIVSYGERHHYVQDKVLFWNGVYLRVSLDFFLLCGFSVIFLWYLEKNITVPIEQLTDIAKGYMDREKKKETAETVLRESLRKQCAALERLHGEPGALAAAFGKMMEDVEHYVKEVTAVTAEKERIRSELTVAARLQADMLPDSGEALKDRKDFDLCTRMVPAKEVGGDFYDFFLLDSSRLALVMADVSGKGVPAALFMVVARTLLRSCVSSEKSLSKAVERANSSLCSNNKNGMFVTVWIGVIDLLTGEMTFVNAGHNAPLLARENGEYRYVTDLSGFVLAGMEDSVYEQSKLTLAAGDALFLYTDGVTEAHDAHKNLYGDDRLIVCLNQQPKRAAEETLEAVWKDLLVFRGKADQFDDITMLSFRFLGAEKRGYKTCSGPAEQGRMGEVRDFLEHILLDGQAPRILRSHVLLAADEIFTNICSYSEARWVTVRCRADEMEAELYFEDDGVPYDPLRRKDPDTELGLDQRETGGLGIYLVKELMNEMSYEYRDGKNCLRLKKNVKRRIEL